MPSDFRQALRSMSKNKGLTAVAALTLALGIGANTVVFSVADAALLRPEPYRDPGRIVTLLAQIPSMNIYGAFVEYNTFVEWWAARNRSFESMWAFSPVTMNLTSGGDPERLDTCRVNAGFVAHIGSRIALGREFLPEEDQPGAARVAMIGEGLGKRRFGGDPH